MLIANRSCGLNCGQNEFLERFKVKIKNKKVPKSSAKSKDFGTFHFGRSGG